VQKRWLVALLLGLALLTGQVTAVLAQGIEGGDSPFFCPPDLAGCL
jgi:hypothetical protein